MNLIKYLLFFILLENTVAFAQGSLGSFGPQTSKRNTKQFEDSLRLFQIAESFATRAMNPCKVLRTRKMKEKMVGEFKKNYNSNLKHEIDKNLALAIKIINECSNSSESTHEKSSREKDKPKQIQPQELNKIIGTTEGISL